MGKAYMKSKAKKKSIVIVLEIVIALSIICTFNIVYDKGNGDGRLEIQNKTDIKKPSLSGSWDENDVAYIHIFADNWSATELPWIQNRTGSWSDPHVIENVTIDSTGRPYGILIENSNDYFIIQNCKVYNTGSGSFDAGIKLENTNNGTLTNNNCSNNGGNGFLIYNSENNTMSGNYVNYNQFGIFFSESNNNTFSGNSANYNTYNGIYLSLSNYTTISGNKASNNNDHGIALLSSNNDNISGNSAYNNTKNGIYLFTSDNNTISGNNATYNKGSGIWLDFSDSTNISWNTVDNNNYGIYLTNSHYNNISGNTAYNNTVHGIDLGASNGNNILGNTAYNNTVHGIYIYDSNNNNISENTAHNNTIHGIWLDFSDSNTVSGNTANDNLEYGITLHFNSNDNNITENYIYHNAIGGIAIKSGTCEDNIISENIIVSNDLFINDSGLNTIIKYNYLDIIPPSFVVEILDLSFYKTEFIVSINLTSQVTFLQVSNISIQMWWNGNLILSNDIKDNGNGFYNVSLLPIFVEPDENPILLNMTFSAAYHNVKYYEMNIAVEPEPDDAPVSVSNLLFIEIRDQSFSLEEFNITFYIYNESNHGIDNVTIQMWWNSTDVSSIVLNLGSGLYFVSLEPITVKPGEDPILFEMNISAFGYEDKSFETYIAVDHDVLLGDDSTGGEAIPGYSIIFIGLTAVGTIGLIYVIFKRKQQI